MTFKSKNSKIITKNMNYNKKTYLSHRRRHFAHENKFRIQKYSLKIILDYKVN